MTTKNYQAMVNVSCVNVYPSATMAPEHGARGSTGGRLLASPFQNSSRKGKRLHAAARVLAIIFCLLATFATANAQVNQGAISGVVEDGTGALIPNAKITAVEVNSGSKYETVSTSSGSYRLPNVNIGTYNITTVASGFSTANNTGVVVQVGTTTALTISLRVGAVNETVTIVSDAPTIQTESSDVGGVITPKQALDLPLNLNGSVVSGMRSPEAFVFLIPGTSGPGTANGNGGTFESKISGGQNYSTEVLLDGASTFRSENGSSFDETSPSVEALSEFKVTTSTLPAELGRTTGGVESFSTKAGTNSYHGVIYDLYKNEALDANNWGNNLYLAHYTTAAARAPYQRPKDKKNDYGLTMGGPLVIPKLYNGRDKTFFFFSWEQYRQTTGGTTISTVPTALMRQGDFSETLTNHIVDTNPCNGQPVYQGQIFDPKTTTTTASGALCRTPFPGNKIPAGYVLDSNSAAVAKNILAFYPAPQSSGLTNNFAYSWSFPILDTSMTVRVDQNLTSKQKLYFTFNSRDNTRTSTTPAFPSAAGAGRSQDFFTHYIRVGYDYAVTPSMLNHLNVGYNRTNSKNTGAGVRYGGGWDAKLGIANGGGRTFPAINVDGVHGLGDNVDGDTIDNGYRLNDTFNWVKGKHDFKFGVDLRYQIYNPLSDAGASGTINFNNFTTAGTVPSNGLSGNGFASLLLGQPGFGGLTAYAGQPKFLSPYYGVFFEDSYKLTPTLTINYGLRWDVDISRRESHDNMSNIDLKATNPDAGGLPGALVFAGKGAGRTGRTSERWVDTWYKDFGPRLGFAWSPKMFDNKTVIRGGGGIFYAGLLWADFGGFLRTGFQGNPAFSSPDGFNPAFNLGTGFPAYTKPPNLSPSQVNFQTPGYVDRSYGRPGMVNNWSLEIQQQVATDLILDVAYVGQRSTHLRSTFDNVNSITPDKFALGNLLAAPVGSPRAIAAGIKLPYLGYPTGQSVGQSLRPYPQFFNFNTDCCLENRGQAGFNALETSLQRRFRDGLNLLASYTWSKTLTNADSALPAFSSFHGGGQIQNPFDPKGEKAISNQDTPHTFVLSYLYELPVGKGKKFLSKGGIVDKVVGGWQVSGVQRYQSGQPLSFYCATGVPAFDGCIRYSRVEGQLLTSKAVRAGHFNPALQPAVFGADPYNALTNPDPYRYFNYQALIDPNTPSTVTSRGSYAFGTQPRTTGEVRSFRYLSEDFSIQKTTHITEKVNVRFQMDMIDAFNRHIFNRPNSGGPNDIFSFGYVDPTSMVNGPRNIQFLMKIQY
ncbi:MAG TPA: carboxypeptidase-like regulatory domain-containing protein [Acidisarcina sp.]|nr:carboxypeptidase-like regulatory domain-containing protein [Acidisarcina sp.]